MPGADGACCTNSGLLLLLLLLGETAAASWGAARFGVGWCDPVCKCRPALPVCCCCCLCWQLCVRRSGDRSVACCCSCRCEFGGVGRALLLPEHCQVVLHCCCCAAGCGPASITLLWRCCRLASRSLSAACSSSCCWQGRSMLHQHIINNHDNNYTLLLVGRSICVF